MKLLERIYSNLPAKLQDLAISMRGYRLRRRRYGTTYHQFSDFLKSTEKWTTEELRDYQHRTFLELVEEARSDTEYYKGAFAKLKLPTSMDLTQVPILEKQTLRTKTAMVRNQRRCGSGDEVCNTSGTSGTPITFAYDRQSMQMNMALRDRQYRWAGIDPLQKSCRFSGRILLGKNNSKPYWRYNHAERQLFFSVYHMREENLFSYVDAMNRFQPVYLDGYPSAIYELALFILSSKHASRIRPSAIFTTAETLTEHQRRTIETAFGCQVFNFYSSSEGAPFIIQCSHGGHHLCPESGIVEILREDGSSAPDGECGEMVITSFFQRAMPLIRYRIGDVGGFEKAPCSCGSALPTMMQVVGRLDDVIISPERGPVGRLDPVFKGMLPTIRLAQIAQTDEAVVELRYLPDTDFQLEHLNPIIENLALRLGNSMKIVPVLLNEAPKASRGKFRAVVREYKIPNQNTAQQVGA